MLSSPVSCYCPQVSKGLARQVSHKLCPKRRDDSRCGEVRLLRAAWGEEMKKIMKRIRMGTAKRRLR